MFETTADLSTPHAMAAPAVVLLASAAVTGVLGEVVDAGVILSVVVVNAVVGFLQEGRAEHALDALVAVVRTEATVIRRAVATKVPSADLVSATSCCSTKAIACPQVCGCCHW